MEIKIGDRTFQIPDACPIDAPKDRILKRHLREHGIESLLASKKLSAFSGCVLDDLVKEGAEIVEPTISAKEDVPESKPSGESVNNHAGSQENPN